MSTRMERAESEVMKVLNEIIHNRMNDPRLNQIVSVSEVSLSPDFRSAKAKISVLELEQAENVVKILQKSEGFIKRELAQEVKMPQIPKIHFVVDNSAVNAMKVEEILKTLNIPKEDR